MDSSRARLHRVCICLAEFCVPETLLELLRGRPLVKSWLVKDLGAIDLPSDAPPVKQLHPNPVTAEIKMSDYLGAAFNNPAQYTNSQIVVDGHEIHVHKMILAQASPVFADHWTKADEPLVVNIICPATGIIVSYTSALVFFSFLYTGEISWPNGKTEAAAGQEILILAATYNVPFLLCAMELALQPFVDFDSCCQMLLLADHHHAAQLRAHCLHFIRSGHRYIASTAEYQQLSKVLRGQVAQPAAACRTQ